MKKSIGKSACVFPMPVLMIAAYDENGKVNVMNAAWGINSEGDEVALCISKSHKTTKNIVQSKAFTIAIADKDHVTEADFFGIASGNSMEDKFERSGLHAVKSEHVNAPIIEEFPITMECELKGIVDEDIFHGVIGKVVNTVADEKVLDENGKVDPEKLNAILFDTFKSGYYTIGEKVGKAWNAGKKFM